MTVNVKRPGTMIVMNSQENANLLQKFKRKHKIPIVVQLMHCLLWIEATAFMKLVILPFLKYTQTCFVYIINEEHGLSLILQHGFHVAVYSMTI